MEFIKQLEELHTVEVSFHGPEEAYFQPIAMGCCSCSGGTPGTLRQELNADNEP